MGKAYGKLVLGFEWHTKNATINKLNELGMTHYYYLVEAVMLGKAPPCTVLDLMETCYYQGAISAIYGKGGGDEQKV